MTIGLETIARGNGSRIVQARQTLARNANEWRALWAAHAGTDSPEPTVDFDTRTVAAVFAGERPTTGFDISVTGSRRAGETLVLTIEEHHPEEGAILGQMMTSPFHIVSVPRHDGQIRFADADGVRTASASPARRRRHEPAPSSTGLTPPIAGTLAYLAGPFSGALLLGVERSSRFVKFHAWQAVLGLGVLGFAALLLLLLAFGMLVISPTAFWVMLWLAAVTAAAWVVIWGICLVQAYRGRLWKLPLAGSYAERRAGLTR
jgi:uncharacterized membrane protein